MVEIFLCLCCVLFDNKIVFPICFGKLSIQIRFDFCRLLKNVMARIICTIRQKGRLVYSFSY